MATQAGGTRPSALTYSAPLVPQRAGHGPSRRCGNWGSAPIALLVLLALAAFIASDRSATAAGGLVLVTPITPPRTAYRSRWAVVIGIDNYTDKSVAPLGFAIKDAQSIRNLLVSDFTFEPDHVLLLPEHDATWHGINEALTQWLPAHAAHVDDLALVFFAGHGFMDPQRVDGYLVPADVQADRIFDTSIKVQWLKDHLSKQVRAQHKVVILDSCYSGTLFQRSRNVAAIDGRGAAWQSGDAAIAAAAGDNLAYYFLEPAFMGISAGRYTPVSDRSSSGGHSEFTSALLAVMKERADSQRPDHAFTFRELAVQVEARVRSGPGSRQIPNWGAIEGEGDVVFVPDQKNRGITPTEQRIAARISATADTALTRDPGLSLAWTREAIRLRGGAQAADYFRALAAFEAGFGWEIQRGSRPVVAFPPRPSGSHQWLAVGAGEKLRVIDLESGRDHPLPAGARPFIGLHDIAFFPDESGLVAADGNLLRIWRLAADGSATDPPIVLECPSRFGFEAVAVAWSGRRIAVGAGDGEIYVTDEPWTSLRTLPNPRAKSSVQKLVFAPGSDEIVVSLDEIMLLHMFDLTPRTHSPLREFQAFDFSFTHDGSLYYLCLVSRIYG